MAEVLSAPTQTAVRRVAIAGNPNCGKSTIFNALTGLRQKVGNYPGVTVERKEGTFFGSHGEPMKLLDLPGSYSLQTRSPDEAVARDVLLGRLPGVPRPDVIIAVIDASNLERNLYLVAQLLELQLPVIVALNMVDMAENAAMLIDVEVLSERLGVPVIPMIATKGVGLIELKQAMSESPLAKPRHRAPMPPLVEQEVHALAKALPFEPEIAFPEALLLLTLHDRALDELAGHDKHIIEAARAAQHRLRDAELDPMSAPVDARYQWIQSICRGAVTDSKNDDALSISDRIDLIFTHRVWGWMAFLAAMTLMFLCIFTVAEYPMNWIDSAVNALGTWTGNQLPDGDLRSLLTDGIIAGVGGVLVFLPQILILFFFIGLLESTGYMARAAFIMDRLMSRVGLNGKSFIPLLSSYACAIPGIMATRTIENRKDRLVTILVAPLMSCSARLPVYLLMIAALAAGERVPLQRRKVGIMLLMYVLGTVGAFGVAWLFKRTLLKGAPPMMMMELPPYRLPAAARTSRCSMCGARVAFPATRGHDHPRHLHRAVVALPRIRSPRKRTQRPRSSWPTASPDARVTRSSR